MCIYYPSSVIKYSCIFTQEKNTKLLLTACLAFFLLKKTRWTVWHTSCPHYQCWISSFFEFSMPSFHIIFLSHFLSRCCEAFVKLLSLIVIIIIKLFFSCIQIEKFSRYSRISDSVERNVVYYWKKKKKT